jgi:hypothetical protein
MILYSEDGSSRYPKSWYQCNRRHVVTYQMNIILNFNLKFIILYDCGLGRVTLKKTYLVSFTISFCALGLKRMNPVDLSLAREANGTSVNKFFIVMVTRTRHLFLSSDTLIDSAHFLHVSLKFSHLPLFLTKGILHLGFPTKTLSLFSLSFVPLAPQSHPYLFHRRQYIVWEEQVKGLQVMHFSLACCCEFPVVVWGSVVVKALRC